MLAILPTILTKLGKIGNVVECSNADAEPVYSNDAAVKSLSRHSADDTHGAQDHIALRFVLLCVMMTRFVRN